MIEEALVDGLQAKLKKVRVDLTDLAAIERKKKHLDRARSELGALSPIRLVRITRDQSTAKRQLGELCKMFWTL